MVELPDFTTYTDWYKAVYVPVAESDVATQKNFDLLQKRKLSLAMRVKSVHNYFKERRCSK